MADFFFLSGRLMIGYLFLPTLSVVLFSHLNPFFSFASVSRVWRLITDHQESNYMPDYTHRLTRTLVSSDNSQWMKNFLRLLSSHKFCLKKSYNILSSRYQIVSIHLMSRYLLFSDKKKNLKHQTPGIFN